MKYHVDFDIDFKRNTYAGKFIAIEGIDGSGKTTQAKKLKEYFEKQGNEVLSTREPGRESVIGKLIHDILQSKTTDIPSEAFQFLFSAERVIHYKKEIIPALKNGKIVISDRVFWSSVPYGMMDVTGGENYDYNSSNIILASQCILSMYHQFIVPDFTFFLNIPVSVAMKRIVEMGKQKEIYEKKEKLEKIASGYSWLAKEFPNEITVIDANRDEKDIVEEIIGLISK